MTIALEKLKKLLSQSGINPSYQYRPEVTKAFITEAAFSVGDQAYSAVVTAQYIHKAEGRFEITFDVLGYIGPAPISLTINELDIRAVREMLGIGKAFPLADYEQDDLAVALHTLREIATAKEGTTLEDQLISWQDIATATINLAQKALDQIEDASNGTPSDS